MHIQYPIYLVQVQGHIGLPLHLMFLLVVQCMLLIADLLEMEVPFFHGTEKWAAYSDSSVGFRPIVCLNSNYTLEKTKDSNGNDAFKIVEQ